MFVKVNQGVSVFVKNELREMGICKNEFRVISVCKS